MIINRRLLLLLLAGISLLMITVACSNPDENHDLFRFDIEGRYMETTSSGNGFYLFVEDSLSGNTYKYLSTLADDLPENYQVEAYRIKVDEETIFVDEATGERLSIEDVHFPFHWPNQRVYIKTTEEFESYKQYYDNHIIDDQRLLPIYIAEKIITSAFSTDDFIAVYSPIKESHYLLFIFDSMFNTRYLATLMDYAAHPQSRNSRHIEIRRNNPSYYRDFFGVTEDPTYIIIAREGKVLDTPIWEEVYDFFQRAEGIGIPREGDIGWQELLAN